MRVGREVPLSYRLSNLARYFHVILVLILIDRRFPLRISIAHIDTRVVPLDRLVGRDGRGRRGRLVFRTTRKQQAGRKTGKVSHGSLLTLTERPGLSHRLAKCVPSTISERARRITPRVAAPAPDQVCARGRVALHVRRPSRSLDWRKRRQWPQPCPRRWSPHGFGLLRLTIIGPSFAVRGPRGPCEYDATKQSHPCLRSRRGHLRTSRAGPAAGLAYQARKQSLCVVRRPSS